MSICLKFWFSDQNGTVFLVHWINNVSPFGYKKSSRQKCISNFNILNICHHILKGCGKGDIIIYSRHNITIDKHCTVLCFLFTHTHAHTEKKRQMCTRTQTPAHTCQLAPEVIKHMNSDTRTIKFDTSYWEGYMRA